MGLDITGWTSKLEYDCGYSCLHHIRALAVQVAKGIPHQEAWDLLMNARNREDPLWNKDYYAWLEKNDLLRFHQLLHFSDAEGMMVKNWVLEGIDVSKSHSLGDLDELNSELEEVRVALTSHPSKYPGHAEHMELFWMLYNLVKDEAENGWAIRFH
jgi:hypothetical protein